MRFKRAGMISKIVILILLIYLAIYLLNLRAQIESTQNLRDALSSQVTSQRIENQQLAEAIENSADPEVLESVARDKGYVKPGETLYIDVAN